MSKTSVSKNFYNQLVNNGLATPSGHGRLGIYRLSVDLEELQMHGVLRTEYICEHFENGGSLAVYMPAAAFDGTLGGEDKLVKEVLKAAAKGPWELAKTILKIHQGASKLEASKAKNAAAIAKAEDAAAKAEDAAAAAEAEAERLDEEIEKAREEVNLLEIELRRKEKEMKLADTEMNILYHEMNDISKVINQLKKRIEENKEELKRDTSTWGKVAIKNTIEGNEKTLKEMEAELDSKRAKHAKLQEDTPTDEQRATMYKEYHAKIQRASNHLENLQKQRALIKASEEGDKKSEIFGWWADASEEKPKGNPEEKSKENPEEKSKENPEEKSKENPEEKSKRNPEEKSKENPEEKSKRNPEEKSKRNPLARPIANPENKKPQHTGGNRGRKQAVNTDNTPSVEIESWDPVGKYTP